MTPEHLASEAVAAYLDGALPPAERSRVEAHLADCDACRAEVVAVARLVRALPRAPRWYVPVGALAAAAAALLLLWSPPADDRVGSPEYREPVITTTVAPVAIAPRGAITAAPHLIWSSVPRVDRYRLTLFDSTGSVVWETQTADTSAVPPHDIALYRGRYFWKVEAQTGWGRWVASELAEFSLGAPQP